MASRISGMFCSRTTAVRSAGPAPKHFLPQRETSCSILAICPCALLLVSEAPAPELYELLLIFSTAQRWESRKDLVQYLRQHMSADSSLGRTIPLSQGYRARVDLSTTRAGFQKFCDSLKSVASVQQLKAGDLDREKKALRVHVRTRFSSVAGKHCVACCFCVCLLQQARKRTLDCATSLSQASSLVERLLDIHPGGGSARDRRKLVKRCTEVLTTTSLVLTVSDACE